MQNQWQGGIGGAYEILLIAGHDRHPKGFGFRIGNGRLFVDHGGNRLLFTWQEELDPGTKLHALGKFRRSCQIDLDRIHHHQVRHGLTGMHVTVRLDEYERHLARKRREQYGGLQIEARLFEFGH